MDENLGKIMIFRGYTKNGSLYYVLECRKCFADFQNAAKKEGLKSENKGFFISDFRKWRLRFPVCERSDLNDRNIKK